MKNSLIKFVSDCHLGQNGPNCRYFRTTVSRGAVTHVRNNHEGPIMHSEKKNYYSCKVPALFWTGPFKNSFNKKKQQKWCNIVSGKIPEHRFENIIINLLENESMLITIS